MRVAAKAPVANIVIEHADRDAGLALVAHALGSTDPDFAIGLITQLTNASIRTGEMNEQMLNFMLAVIKSISPQDEIESMLAAQMAAVHMMTMDFTMRLANANTIQQRDSAERALNKLARTFTTQVEALKRHRTGGQQKVTVEHVHVHEGGQAIVGHVEHSAEGVDQKRNEQPHAMEIADAPQPTMRGSDETRERVPVTRDAERTVPDARRKVTRCSEGQ
jgi:hypothetical protein